MSLSEGQIITYMTDEVINTLSNLCPMAMSATKYAPEAGGMQRSNNIYWVPVEQEAPTQSGWDLSGKDTDILELSVPCTIGEPDNDFFSLRADDVRDETSLRRRINASAKKLASNVEMAIAKNAVETGTLFVTSNNLGANGGWDFLASAEEIMFSREINRDAGLSVYMNAADYKAAGHDLIGKDYFGRIVEEAYTDGKMQKQVAGFNNVYRSPKLPKIKGQTATGVKVSGAQTFKPEAATFDADGNPTNVDNRVFTLKVTDTTGLKRGDKFTVAGVKFLSQMTKEELDLDATFSIAKVVDGTNIQCFFKPVAKDDVSLKAEEAAYANVSTSFADQAAITFLNSADATANVFWADDSITIVSQPIPLTHEMFAGMKAEPFSIPEVGLNGVIAYQGDINSLTGKCRIAVWYGVCNKRPDAVGVGVKL